MNKSTNAPASPIREDRKCDDAVNNNGTDFGPVDEIQNSKDFLHWSKEFSGWTRRSLLPRYHYYSTGAPRGKGTPVLF